MNKEIVRQRQPVVYQALDNACREGRISSAWLFSGPAGTCRHEAAVLLAQSILCEKQDGLACEECRTCRRVENGTFADLIILSGAEKAISKDDIDSLQERFSKTALEKGSGQRVYIIENAENASIAAQNSMLKFLEEPGSGITAILTTDNINRLLPTIISRCTVLTFVPAGSGVLYEDALQEGIDPQNAYFVSRVRNEFSTSEELVQSEEYEKAVMMMKQMLGIDGLIRDEFLIDYDVSYRAQGSDTQKAKRSNIRMLNLFFDLMLMYAHDVIMEKSGGPEWYVKAVRAAQKTKEYYGKLVILLYEQRDKVSRFNDLNLLISQTFLRMEAVNE